MAIDLTHEYVEVRNLLDSLFSKSKKEWDLREVGNGNINFIYIADDGEKKLLVKKALPFARISPETFPLAIDRNGYEYAAFRVYESISPTRIPELYGAGKGWIAMEYLSPHVVLRQGLLAGNQYPLVGEHLGTFMAEALYHTSLAYLGEEEHAQMVKRFDGNTEMRKIIEDLDYTDPFQASDRNQWLSPELDDFVAEVQSDSALRAIAHQLREEVIEQKEALMHGDLHTGSVMVTATDTRIIDPEFAIYGPMAFDPSRLLANFLMTFFAAPVHGIDSNHVIDQVRAMWNSFERTLKRLWDEAEEQMQPLWRKTLQHAGVEIFRRTIGIAGVADFRSISERALRARIERRALALGRRMMLHPEAFPTIEALIEAAQGLTLNSLAIRYEKGILQVLNQQKLPTVEEWLSVEAPEQMIEIIQSLKVRGAPLIGVAGVLPLLQMAERGETRHAIEKAAKRLREARPTAVNLAACIDRVMKSPDLCAAVQQVFEEDIALCRAMGQAGSELIESGERILTYCNTGSLATAGIGTALGVIKTAHAQGKQIHVFACETRPLLQGGRLTAWELEQNKIPYTLICDNMAATLMRSGKIDRVLVGADRIAANGDFANKIGTYNLAVLAAHHKIPFHVVAPYTTVDLNCKSGDGIVIEERSPQEVRGYGTLQWSPASAPVFNPAFDVTPAHLVTSYILDRGNVQAHEISGLVPAQVVEEILSAGRFLDAFRLCPANAGNVSVRLRDNQIAITASSIHKGKLKPDEVILIDLQGKLIAESPKKPSSDTILHTTLYQNLPYVGAVIHAHTLNGVVLSKYYANASSIVTKRYAQHRSFPGISTHESEVTIPIFEDNPDLSVLAKQIAAYVKTHPLIYGLLLRGHGIYTWGETLQEARHRIEAFEYLFESEWKLTLLTQHALTS